MPVNSSCLMSQLSNQQCDSFSMCYFVFLDLTDVEAPLLRRVLPGVPVLPVFQLVVSALLLPEHHHHHTLTGEEGGTKTAEHHRR